MKTMKLTGLVTFALLASCAQQPSLSANSGPQAVSTFQDASGQGADAAKDIAITYDRICLAAFPDEARLQGQLANSRAVELDEAEVRFLLHGDPGRGWRLSGSPFIVTVEAPPYRTCAVRRMTRDGLPSAKPYVDAVDAYAQQHGLLKGQVQQVAARLASGADTLLLATPLSPAGMARPAETSIYATTNYHGRLDPTRFPDTAGGVGVEVRLAHQLIPSR